MVNQNQLIKQLRKEYQFGGLEESKLPKSPMEMFEQWFRAAVDDGLPEPNGMTVVSVGEDGRPSARIVLMKSFDERGIVFYTNYESRKGRELIGNPAAAIVFWWREHERQVRFEGRMEKVSEEESDRYFASRPRGSRLGAWISPQSREIASRETLESRRQSIEANFPEGRAVPRPPHWGGFRLVPDRIEFWHGRPNRLHDRILYTLSDEDRSIWGRTRLAP